MIYGLVKANCTNSGIVYQQSDQIRPFIDIYGVKSYLNENFGPKSWSFLVLNLVTLFSYTQLFHIFLNRNAYFVEEILVLLNPWLAQRPQKGTNLAVPAEF